MKKHPSFVMSKFLNREQLFKAKAEHYQQQYEVLSAAAALVSDLYPEDMSDDGSGKMGFKPEARVLVSALRGELTVKHPAFVMSKFLNAQDLYEAKSEHFRTHYLKLVAASLAVSALYPEDMSDDGSGKIGFKEKVRENVATLRQELGG